MIACLHIKAMVNFTSVTVFRVHFLDPIFIARVTVVMNEVIEMCYDSSETRFCSLPTQTLHYFFFSFVYRLLLALIDFLWGWYFFFNKLHHLYFVDSAVFVELLRKLKHFLFLWWSFLEIRSGLITYRRIYNVVTPRFLMLRAQLISLS